jgi:PKD repeat protein
MKRENIELILGGACLALGIIIMIYVFTLALPIAQDPGGFLEDQLPEEEEEVEPPKADFRWNSNDLTVDFRDNSEDGDNPITSWYWEFGDGQTSTQQNPSHTYSSEDEYFVTLEVNDGQGNSDNTEGHINVRSGDSDGGSSEEDFGDFNFEIGDITMPIAIVFLTFFMYIIVFLVGAAITKAGWNLVKPKPRYVKIKIKPKDFEAEPAEGYQPQPAYGGAAAYPQQPASQPYPPQSGAASTPPAQQESEPPPPGVGPMCPNCGADVKTGWMTCPTCGANL